MDRIADRIGDSSPAFKVSVGGSMCQMEARDQCGPIDHKLDDSFRGLDL